MSPVNMVRILVRRSTSAGGAAKAGTPRGRQAESLWFTGHLPLRLKHFAPEMRVRGQSPPVLKTASMFRKFGPLIYSRCRRALHDEGLALRATEEVFVRVLPSLDDSRTAVAALSGACQSVCQRLQSTKKSGVDSTLGSTW